MFCTEKCERKEATYESRLPCSSARSDLFSSMADALSNEGLPADDVASAVAAASDEIGDILKDELGDAEHAERIGAELADLSAELGLLAGLAEGEPRKVEFPSLFEMAMRERARASTGGATSGASSSSSSSGGSRRAPARRHPRTARRQLVAACKAQQQSTRAAARARAGASCRVARSRRSSAASSRRGASDADDDLDDDDDEWTELEDGASSGASSVKGCGTVEEIASSYETCNAYSHTTQAGSPSGTAEAPPLGQFLLPLLTDAGEEAATDFVIRHEDILQVLASAEECARNDIAKMVAESTGQEYQPPRAGEPSPSFNESAERLIVEKLRALSVGPSAPADGVTESPEVSQAAGADCCEDSEYEADVRAVMEFVESLEGKVLEANEVPLTRVEGCFFGLWNTYYEFNTLMVTTFAASTCGLENSEWTYRVRLFCNCCSCAFRNMNLCSLLQYVDGLVYDLARDESTMRDAVLLSRALGVIGGSAGAADASDTDEGTRREPCLCGRRPEHVARRDVRAESLPPAGGVLPLSRKGCVVVGRRLVALAAAEPSLRQLLTQACCCQPGAVHVPPVAPSDGCPWAAECLTRLLRSFLAAGDRVAKVEIRCTSDSEEHESRAARANARLDSLTTSAATGAVVRRGEAARGQQVGFRVRHSPLAPTHDGQAFVPPCLRCWCHCQASKLLGMEQRKDLYLKCIKIMLGMYMVMNGGGAAGAAGGSTRTAGAPDEVWAARMQVPFQNILQAGTILLGAAAQTTTSINSNEESPAEEQSLEAVEGSDAPEASSGGGKVSTAVGTEDHQVADTVEDMVGDCGVAMETEEVGDDTGGENCGGDGAVESAQPQVEASSSPSTDDDSQAESDSNTSNSESNSSEEGAESSGDDGLTRTIDHLMRSIGSIECLMDRVLEHCEPARAQDPRETQKQVNHGLSEVDRKLMAMYRRLPEIHQKQMEVYRKQKKLSMLVSARMSRGGPLPPPPPPPLPAAAPPQPAAPSMFALSEYHLARFKEVRRKVMHMREQQLYYHRLRLWLEGQLRLEHMQAEECASSTNDTQDEQKSDRQQANSETEEGHRQPTATEKEEDATTEEAEDEDEDEEDEEEEEEEEVEEGEEDEEEEVTVAGEGEESSGGEEEAGEVGQAEEMMTEGVDESKQSPVQPAQQPQPHNNTSHHQGQGQIITMDSIYHQQLRPKARPRGAAKRKLRSQPHRTLEALRWKSAPSLRAAPLFRSRALTRELERKKMETDRLREEVEAPKAFMYDERANVTEVDVTSTHGKASVTGGKDCDSGAKNSVMSNKDNVIVSDNSVTDDIMTKQLSDGKHLKVESVPSPYPDSASPPLHDLSPTNLDVAVTSKTITRSSMVTVNKLLSTPVTVFDQLKADIRADFVKFGTPYLSKMPDDSSVKAEESEAKDTSANESKDSGVSVEGKDSKKGYKYVAFGLEIKKAIEECQSIINSCNTNTNGEVCDLSRSISVDLADVSDSAKANADIMDNASDSALSLEQIYESILNLDKNSAELLEAYDVQNEPDLDEDVIASSDDAKFAEVVESMPQILANMPEIASKLSEFANLSCELPEFASIVSNLPECTNESQLTPETLKQIRELKINKSRDNVKVTKYMFKRKNVRKQRNSSSDNDVLGTLLDYEVKDLPELYKEDIEKEMKVHMTRKSYSKDEYKDLVCFVTAQVVTNKIFECIRQAKDYELAKCLLDSKLPKSGAEAKTGGKTAASAKTEKENANANVKSAQVSPSDNKDDWKDKLEACKRSVFTKFKNIPSQWLESEIEKMSEKIPVSFISCIRSLAEKHDKMKNDLQGKDSGKSSVESMEKKSEQSEEDIEEISPPKEVKNEKEEFEEKKEEVAPATGEAIVAESSKSNKVISEPVAEETLIEIVTKVTGDSKEAASLDAKMIQSSKLCKEAVNSMKCTSNMKFKYMDVITRCAESPELAGWIMLDPGIAANVILEMTGMTPKKLGGEDFSTYSNDRKQAYFIERLQEMNRDYIQSLPKNIFSTDEWLVLLYQLEMLEVKLKVALSKVCSPKKKPAQTQTASSMASETREAELVAGKGLSRIINNCNFKSVKRPSPAVLETIAKEAAAKEQAEKAILEQRKIELSKQYPPEPNKNEPAEVKKEDAPAKPDTQPKEKTSEAPADRVDKILSVNTKSGTAKPQPQPNPESENKQNQELDKKTKNNILLAKCEAILKVKGDKELLERFYVIKSCITQGLPVPEGYKKHVISICKGIDAKLLDIEEMIRKNNKSSENDKTDSQQCQKANKEMKQNESGRKCSSESDPTCVHSDENDSDSHCHSPAMCCPCDPKTGQHIAIIGSQNPELLAKYSAQALRNAKQSLNVVAFNSIRNGNGKGDSEHGGEQDKSWNVPKSDCKWTNDCICSGCRGNGSLGANANSISLGDIVKQCYDYDINAPNGGNPTVKAADPPTKDGTESAAITTSNDGSKESAASKDNGKASAGSPGAGVPAKGQRDAGNGRGAPQGGSTGGGGNHQHVCRVGHTQGSVGACTGEGGQNPGFNGDHPCNCCYCTVFGHAPPLTTPVPRNYNETRERLRSILNRKKQRCKAGAASPQESTPPPQQQPQAQQQQQPQQQPQQPRQSASPQTNAPSQGTAAPQVAPSGTTRPPPGFAYPPAGPPLPPVHPASLVAAAASHANLAERMARMTLDPASSGSAAAAAPDSERNLPRPAAAGAESTESRGAGSAAAKGFDGAVKTGDAKRVGPAGQVQGKQLTNYWRGNGTAPAAPARSGQPQQAAGPQARVASSRDTSAFSTSSGYSGFSGGIEEGEHIEDTRDLDALLQYIEGPAKVLDRSKKRAKKARQKAKKIEQRIQCERAELAALTRAHARLTATMRAEHERARRGVEEARAALRAAQRTPQAAGGSGASGGRRRGKKSSTTCPTLQAKVQAAAERLGELTNALKVSSEALVKAEQKRSELDGQLAACLAALREARLVQGLHCESDGDERDPQLEHDEDVRDDAVTGTEAAADASGAPYVVRIRRVALGGESGVTLSLAAGARAADTPLYALVGGRAVALRPDVPDDIAAFAAASSGGSVASSVTQQTKNAGGGKDQQGKKQCGNEPEKQLNKKAKEKKNQEQKALSEAQKNVATNAKSGKSNVTTASGKENNQLNSKKLENAKVAQNHVSLKSSNASSSSIDHSRSTSISDVPLTKKQRKILAKQQAAEKSRQEEEAAKKAKQKEKESKSKEKKKVTEEKGKKGKSEIVDSGKGGKKDEGKNKAGSKVGGEKSGAQGKEKDTGKVAGGKSTANSAPATKKQETAQAKNQNQPNGKSGNASKKNAGAKSGQDQQQNQSKTRQVGPETTIEVAQKKPSGQHSKPTLSSSDATRGSPASCSIMEQLSCGVQVADLKLPPGITLTRVDPSKQVITNNIKSVPLSKAPQLPTGPTPPVRPSPQIITAYPGAAGAAKQPGVIVMDSHGHHPTHLPEPLKLDLGLATARQPGKSKKAKKKARAAAAAAASGLNQYQNQPNQAVGSSTSGGSGARMVTLRNPMFHPGLPAVSVATENGVTGNGGGGDRQGRTEQQTGGKRHQESNIRIPDPIPMPPAACQATITPTSNGMYTIRNPLMSMVHQQGLLRAPGPPSSAQHINPLLGNQPTQYASQPYLANANLANYAQHTSANNATNVASTVPSTSVSANHNQTQPKTNSIQNYEANVTAPTQMSPAPKLTDSNAVNNTGNNSNGNNSNTGYDSQQVASEYNNQQRNDSGIAGFQHSNSGNITNNSQQRSANVGMNLASFAQQNEEGYSLFKTNSAGETNCHQTSSVHFLSSDSAFGNSFTDYAPAKTMMCSPNPIGTSRPQNNGVESNRSCYGLASDTANGVANSTLYSSEAVRTTGVIGQSTRPEPIGKPLSKRSEVDNVTSQLSSVGFGGYAGALYTPFGTGDDRDFRSSLFSSGDQESSSVFCLPADGRRAFEEARAPFGVDSGDSLPYFQRLRVGARLNNEVTIHHVTESKFYKTGLEPAIPPPHPLASTAAQPQPSGAVEITLLSHAEETTAGVPRKGPAWGHATCSAQSSAGSSLSGSSAHSPADAGGYHRLMMESVSEECCVAPGVESGSFGPVGAVAPRLANGTAGRQRPLGLHQAQQGAQAAAGFYAENSIFAPDQSITNLAELDSTDRDIESFKRFEFYFEPPRNKPKVQLNVQDLALHQHSGSSGVSGNSGKETK